LVSDHPNNSLTSAIPLPLFNRFREFIQSELGIKMPDSKHIMLRTRLHKRMRRLNIGSFDAYYQYVFSPAGRAAELQHMLDAVTTNKTDFFREPKHFDILTQVVLPQIYRPSRFGHHRPLAVWSAGCSTGAEPYTLAMVLNDARNHYPDLNFRILATDISTRVLDIARSGIYEERDGNPIPLDFKKQFILRSKDPCHAKIRMGPELRKQVEFRQLNFMQEDYGIQTLMDVIFCRNVIIYFERPTQARVVGRLCEQLRPGGYLFMGHSETLNGMGLPVLPISANVYRKIEGPPAK
jgi:chemotaxis protein methyltransferase CheR